MESKYIMDDSSVLQMSALDMMHTNTTYLSLILAVQVGPYTHTFDKIYDNSSHWLPGRQHVTSPGDMCACLHQ